MTPTYRVLCLSCLLLALLCAGPLLAVDGPAVLAEAEANCAREHASYSDVTIIQDVMTSTAGGPLSAEQRIYQSRGRTRVDMVMAMPAGAGMDSLHTVVIDDGHDTWMINPFSGKTKLDDADAARQELPHDCWGFTPQNARITGEATAQGRSCYLVELNRDSVTHTLWLDKETLTVLEGESRDGEGKVRWVLSDFRPVTAEYRHPYKVEMFEGEQLLSTMTVRSVTVDAGLADELFDAERVEPPALDMQELMRRAMEAQGAMEADSLLVPDSLR